MEFAKSLTLSHCAKNRFFAPQLMLIVSLFIMPPVSAQSEVFRARMSPMPTTPQTVNEILGKGEVILTLAGNTLTIAGSFEGMSSAATAAHLHSGPPARPGPVIHTLNANDASAGEITAQLQLSDDEIAKLKANNFYIQIHSINNPLGELRGWFFLRSHFQ
jgi:hypothetical protein